MPSTVVVNNLTLVHKDSGGVSTAFPDVCKTPTPGGPIPIPYPNVAMSSDTADGTKNVKCDGKSVMIKTSNFKTSTGDEAGSAQGVVSNKIKGKAEPKLYSMDVKFEGGNVFRLSDIMLHNVDSAPNTPPTPEVQAPGLGMGKGDDPEEPKVTELKIDKQECACGDEVKVSVKTTNFKAQTLSVPMKRDDKCTSLVDTVDVKVSGDAGDAKWVVIRGPYVEEAKILATQTGYEGEKKSAQPLKVKAPAPTKQANITVQRSAPVYVDNNVGGVPLFLPTGGNFGWEAKWDIELDKGALVVTRKLDWDLQRGCRAPWPGRKRAWKREIENIWDKKFRLHRKDCKRGKDCKCSRRNGCCHWIIRFVCRYESGHGKVNLYPGANHPRGNELPWDPNNVQWWYSHHWWEYLSNVPRTVRAHEFGHLIGMYDEYPEGACEGSRAWANVPDSIMNAGTTVYPRHMVDFHQWFKDKFSGIVGETDLIRA